jgi:hypothetical protein
LSEAVPIILESVLSPPPRAMGTTPAVFAVPKARVYEPKFTPWYKP